MTIKNPARRLRELFAGDNLIRLIGAHDALGAKMAERTGFDGVWSSGLEISTSRGVPDANILTMSDYLAAAESMADAVRLPIVADCDTGYGNSNNVIHMVKRFESAGVAAVCIEDKLFPKVNSFVPGRQELASVAEFVGKIMAAKNAQRNADFMVIARTEALIAGWGMSEALKRAEAYVKAGADAILIHSKEKTVAQIATFLKEWGGRSPVVIVPTTYPDVTTAELRALGVKMVIYANQGLRAAVRAMERTLTQILADGCTTNVEDSLAPMSLLFELQGMSEMKRDEATYLRSGRSLTRAVILAAGDHRAVPSMREIAEDVPLAMLDVGGKPLLRRQVETLNRAGVQDVTVVTGYRHEAVTVDGVRKVANTDWHATGEMASLACAGSGGEGVRTLVIYGDILFDLDAINKLLQVDGDVALLVDRTYAHRQIDTAKRLDLVAVERQPERVRRFLQSENLNPLVKIGKNLAPSDATCEFTGLALFSPEGFRWLAETYSEARDRDQNAPFQEASSALRASLTDALQEMVDRGFPVSCLETTSGWIEIHSFDDYQLAYRMIAG